MIDSWGISCKIALRWVFPDRFNEFVNICSGNSLVPSGTINCRANGDSDMFRHMASPGHSEIMAPIQHDVRLKTYVYFSQWWRHQMETSSALLAMCAGNSPVTGEFPAQRPVTRSFDVFFDPRLNKLLSKQSRCWLFETPSRPLWRHCNELCLSKLI